MTDQSIQAMRNKLKYRTKYDSPNWRRKVDQMHDDQVIAVYMRFQSQKMFIK